MKTLSAALLFSLFTLPAWAGLPIQSPAEMVVLASIVEKETGKADERPEIAALFTTRLKRGMRLQSDPTIVYGITRGVPLVMMLDGGGHRIQDGQDALREVTEAKLLTQRAAFDIADIGNSRTRMIDLGSGVTTGARALILDIRSRLSSSGEPRPPSGLAI